MKYRVLEQNGRFYPQYKGIFFWNYFTEINATYMDCYGFPEYVECVVKGSLEEANNYIRNKERIEEEKSAANNIIIHPYPPKT